MKLEMKNNQVVAFATTEEESLSLIRLAYKKPEVVKKQKYKKDIKMRECGVCGKMCKGLNGIGVHMARAHNGLNWSTKPKGTPEALTSPVTLPVVSA